MASGPQTTIALLSQKLQRRWVPKWYEAFTKGADGGFHERLGHSFKPIKTGQRRLLTQCRQLAVYANAVAEGNTHFKPALGQHLDFILTYYKGSCDGGWVFSVDDDLVTQEEEREYALTRRGNVSTERACRGAEPVGVYMAMCV